LYFADGDDQTGSHLIPIQPAKKEFLHKS